jgi:hypothetical protein
VFSWDTDTTPFSAGGGAQPGRFVFQQIDDDNFRLTESIWFTPDDGSRPPLEVNGDVLKTTDLASIPGFLGWFARRHGRHTPAALLHDALVRPELLPDEWRGSRREADLTFRRVLRATDVPPVRAYILWAGTNFASRASAGAARLAAVVVWLLAALTGSALLALGAVTANVPLIVVSLVAPVPFAVLWGRDILAGIVAGYAFWPVVLGGLPAFVAFHAINAVELLVLGLRKLRPRNRPYRHVLSRPVPWHER